MTWTKAIIRGFATIGKGMAEIFGSIPSGSIAKYDSRSTPELLEADRQSIANDWRKVRQELSETTEEFRQSMCHVIKREDEEYDIGGCSSQNECV